MSTRGSVAWRLPNGSALGVYNHNCSQPTALGCTVLKEARTLGLEGLVAKLKSNLHTSGADELFDPFLDPLFMEWVYVLDPVRNLIEVWASAEHDPVKLRGYRGSGRSVLCHRGAHYTHVLAAEVPLDSQPDWAAIERVRSRVAA